MSRVVSVSKPIGIWLIALSYYFIWKNNNNVNENIENTPTTVDLIDFFFRHSLWKCIDVQYYTRYERRKKKRFSIIQFFHDFDVIWLRVSHVFFFCNNRRIFRLFFLQSNFKVLSIKILLGWDGISFHVCECMWAVRPISIMRR